ncbi:Iron-sulfur cluster co-chaperone protein HscB, mitochondrial [Aphelenchoides besseyi]|nr:Iron-sulfur cluster co-chaperone protein HscB, mitochondrial [Aphelenchoides besseyi]KAI6226749.1 Iron-sulfur cluster co-chaperone protein HscB, mitochondrial [Aphelenchoides besseyi]
MLRFLVNGIVRRQFSSPVQILKCWKCEHQFQLTPSKIFCSKCHAVQPLSPNVDYFSYLELEKNYRIEEEALKKKFRSIQSHVHPDKHAGTERKQQEFSEQHSSYLNQAYKTLKDPRSRAAYLLELMTNKALEETKDNEMAAKIFEFMTEIDEMDNPEDLKRKAEEIDSKVEKLLSQVEAAFQQSDMKSARSILNRLRYFDRAKKIIDKKL